MRSKKELFKALDKDLKENEEWGEYYIQRYLLEILADIPKILTDIRDVLQEMRDE